MTTLISHELNPARKQKQTSDGRYRYSEANRKHRKVPSSAAVWFGVSDYHDREYRPEDRKNNLHHAENSSEHISSPIQCLIMHRRTDPATLEAVGRQAREQLLIILVLTAALVTACGAVGFERVNRAYEIASRV